jgi:5-methylcytosine-specific restriction endonuclease McrA
MKMSKCELCDRDIPDNEISMHHLIPKTFKGKRDDSNLLTLHKVCHMKLHSLFSERDMLHLYNTLDMIKTDKNIEKFVKWIIKKPIEFNDSSKDSISRKGKRRY